MAVEKWDPQVVALRETVRSLLDGAESLPDVRRAIRRATSGGDVKPYADTPWTALLLALGAGLTYTEAEPLLDGWTIARAQDEVQSGPAQFQWLAQRMSAMARIGSTRMLWDKAAQQEFAPIRD